jgi:hypothetical protein
MWPLRASTSHSACWMPPTLLAAFWVPTTA